MTSKFTDYRRKHRLSQQELADKLGISRQLVGLIERGRRRITPDNAARWAPVLGVKREHLSPLFRRRPTAESATA